MTQNFRWLRGIHTATFYDKKTNLNFEIKQNPDNPKLKDKFLYRCIDSNNKLLFERKINFATAIVVVNSWKGEPKIKQFADKG